MKPEPQKTCLAIWQEIRREFVEGRATIAQLAQKFGVRQCTAERQCRIGGWLRLRKQRDDHLARMLAPAALLLPSTTPVTIAPPPNAQWLETGQREHLSEFSKILIQLRNEVEARLRSPGALSANELVRLAGAVNTLEEVSGRLFGIVDGRRTKRRVVASGPRIISATFETSATRSDNESNNEL